MLAERVKTRTEEWRREGMQQGMHLGEAKVLRRQLARRYGPLPAWVDQRLEQAAEADLERWADHVLDRERLEEVFDESS